MSEHEIENISKDCTVTYLCICVDFRPQKADPYWVRLTMSGNLMNVPGGLNTKIANMSMSKILLNSFFSVTFTKLTCIDTQKYVSTNSNELV